MDNNRNQIKNTIYQSKDFNQNYCDDLMKMFIQSPIECQQNLIIKQRQMLQIYKNNQQQPLDFKEIINKRKESYIQFMKLYSENQDQQLLKTLDTFFIETEYTAFGNNLSVLKNKDKYNKND